MIKARGTQNDGTPLVLIGLSNGNVRKLKERQPILTPLKDLGIDASLLIMWGETEAAIERELRDGGVDTCPGHAEPVAPHPPVGPTGEYPRGKLNATDSGALTMAVAHDDRGNVVVDFGTPVKWLGLPVSEARGLAELILHHVKELEAIPGSARD